ncbi:hypothetical protein Pelo_11341 [Pelomyxa schiedti]|nr:hypothetical protein Pelo_11341 [Pelomyxa schiedti]
MEYRLVLSSFVLFLGTSTAVWEEHLYYEMSDYSTCNSLIYVEVLETSSCSETSYCYSGYDYNWLVKCHDQMPDMDSYFEDEYYSSTIWSDMLGTKVTGFIVVEKSCVMSIWSGSYRGWVCDELTGKLSVYCITGSHYDDITPSSYNRWGEVFYYDSEEWYALNCDTKIPGYQLITYYAIEHDSSATCVGSPILGYEYFYTDDCVIQDAYECGPGFVWKETLSCTDIEPEPTILIPDTTNPPFVLQYIDTNDNFCSGDVFTTQLWKSSCLALSSTSLKVVESSSSLNFESFSSMDCTGVYLSVDYISKGGDWMVPGCYSTYEEVWYTLSKNQVTNEKYQTVEYHAGADATATTMMTEQYFSHYCETKTVSATDSEMFQNWLCTDLDTLPDPFDDYWNDALLNVYYGVEASTCGESRDWLYRRAMNRDCVADVDTSKGYWHFDCSSNADAASLQLYQGGDSNCTGGSYFYLEDSSPTHVVDYCYPAYYADDSYFELHCDPPNPGYQIIKTYTDTAKTELISVEVFYTQYCTEVEPTSSNFALHYSCQASIDTLTIDIDMPITVSRFSDSTCTTSTNHWTYYSPECHNSDITTDSYHVMCSADESKADIEVYSCDADTLDECRGSCSYFSEEVDATRWSGYPDGCFWDEKSGSYMTVECAPANAAWQAIYSFPGPNVVETTSDKVIEVHYFWSENCVEYNIGWTYASSNYVQVAACTADEPDVYSLWDDAYVVHVIDTDDDTVDSTWGYNPGCVPHQTAAASYSHLCTWETSTFDGSISTLSYSSTADCTGTSTIYSVTPVGVNTESYTTDYFCLSPNNMWQVVKMHLYDEDDPIYRIVTYINPFCQELNGTLGSSFYEAVCREIGDDPQGGDYFTDDPVEILWFTDSTCTGNVAYTSWYNLDCMAMDTTYYAFLSYCSIDNAEVTLATFAGTECPTSLESVYYSYDIVTPTRVPSTVCNDQGSSFDDELNTEYYQISSCGAFNDLIRYNVEILIDDDDCSGVPVYVQGTLTRFCGYSEDGNCNVEDEESGTYLNQTCLDQSSISEAGTTFEGGAVLLSSGSDSCNLEEITEVFFYRGGDCLCNNKGGCWSLKCTHTTGDGERGLVTFTSYSSAALGCDEAAASVDEYPDGECDGSGKLWLCSAQSLGAVASLLLLLSLVGLIIIL